MESQAHETLRSRNSCRRLDIRGSKIQEQHQPSDFKLQDAAMSISLDTNDIVKMFQVRATAELKRELDEAKWWKTGSVVAS
jgi:hypothetical protein